MLHVVRMIYSMVTILTCLLPSAPVAGDIVDYHNTLLPDCPDSGLPASETALREVLQHFDRLGRPTLHLLG